MSLGYVGVLTVRLEMPWVGNLKEKRALVRPVVERLKSRFPLTVARLDGLDAHDWEVIGVATLSNDYGWVRETLKMAANYIASEGEYRVTDEHTEITALGEQDEEVPDE
ncbi:DUF503 family protein [Deinococcus sp.]|uniref:DUF503 domain-containing protein n=1 Tax=Deinococcus sp. TaxID=47478 RepID=UPI0025BA9A4B|nr:DUF503 family protein [Deinococcus sp.]